MKGKILSLSIVVLFAFVVTIGATFAWFTIGQAAEVDEITLNVRTSESLLILMDTGRDYLNPTDKLFLDNPSNYSSSLTNTMISNVYDYTLLTMMPLTSQDGKTFSDRNSVANDITPLPNGNGTIPNGNYMEFSVWVMSQSVNSRIAIGDFLVTATNDISYKDRVTDTIRMSITVGTSDSLIYGHDKDLDFTYQPGQVGYVPGDTQISSGARSAQEGLYASYYKDADPGLSTEWTDDKSAATEIIELIADTPTKITIRIWIEGWDADADNNLIGAIFSLSFQFIVKDSDI